jgi:hypothetical protein
MVVSSIFEGARPGLSRKGVEWLVWLAALPQDGDVRGPTPLILMHSAPGKFCRKLCVLHHDICHYWIAGSPLTPWVCRVNAEFVLNFVLINQVE